MPIPIITALLIGKRRERIEVIHNFYIEQEHENHAFRFWREPYIITRTLECFVLPTFV